MAYGILQILKKVSISSKLWWRISLLGVFALITSAIVTFGTHPGRDLGAFAKLAKSDPLFKLVVEVIGKTY